MDVQAGPRPPRARDIPALVIMTGGPIVLLVLAAASLIVSVVALITGTMPPVPALLGVVATVLYVVWFQPWTAGWGSTAAERARALPGDEFISRPGIDITRAITIDAPPERVWPWIAQIGQDRGGFYSYTWLENLAGCHMHNADRIHPEWQTRDIGDLVLLHPANGIPVTRFEPGRVLALQGWYLVLEPLPNGKTRLFARSRSPKGLASVAYALLIDLPHFIMERKMMLTIKRRAERDGVHARAPSQRRRARHRG